MSRSEVAKPRWMEVADAVKAEIDRTKDRAAAINSVAAYFSIKQEIVHRAMKCDSYVAQHRQRGGIIASQTNIEMLMALEQIDPEEARNYRVSVLSGDTSYTEIAKAFKKAKKQVEGSSVLRVSMDGIRKRMFDDLPGLMRKSVDEPVRVDPMWIGADLSRVLKGDDGKRYEWCCIVSPFFSASSLRGQGRSSLLRSMASACALFDGVSVMVVDEGEMTWAAEQAAYITSRVDTLLTIHVHRAAEIHLVSDHTPMSEVIGLDPQSDPRSGGVHGAGGDLESDAVG